MDSALILPLMVLISTKTAYPLPVCPENQTWMECDCPWDCLYNTISHVSSNGNKVWNGLPRGCYGQPCASGCQCDEKHFNDGRGNCVVMAECPSPTCVGDNERHAPYYRPRARSCRNMLGIDLVDPVAPEEFEIRPCLCKRGYLFDDEGVCVKVKDCPNYPQQCPDGHMEFKECISPCNVPSCPYEGIEDLPSLDFYRKLLPQLNGTNLYVWEPVNASCTDECVSGCFCKDGFLMDWTTKRCVPVEECPPSASLAQVNNCRSKDPNSMILACGPLCNTWCDEPVLPRVCELGCSAGCYCKQGYVKNFKGKCVTRDQCELPWS